MWTLNDKKFLWSLQIQSSDPAPLLPRFRVEPADAEGRYRVIDAKTPRSTWMAKFDTRAAAQACADDMNGRPSKGAKS